MGNHDLRQGAVPSFTRPYWEATRDQRLVIQYDDHGRPQFFPMPISLKAARRSFSWREVEPAGELFAYTITHRAPNSFDGPVPYVVATITLDVGVRLISNLVDCPPAAVRIGMRVSGTWLPLQDGTHLLQFRPDPKGSRR
jgi:uncharacterized OB-fold protein